MDLLDSLVTVDGQACSQIFNKPLTMMPSSQERRISRTVDDMRSDPNSQALAVGLASSQQHNNTFTLPEEREFEDAHEPPPSGQSSQKENEPSFNYHGLQLQSIEQFDEENPYIPKTKQSTNPPPKPNSGVVIQFHILCDMHGLHREFTITEVQGQGFRAKVEAGSIIEEINYAYHSKQAAKEAVCQLAVPRLEALPQSTGNKRKAASPLEESRNQVDSSENWIGIVQEYTQKEKKPPPSYNAMPTSTGEWTCTCTLAMVYGSTKVFGSKTISFRSKQDAKAMCAKDAVVWLRQQGNITPAGVKRHKLDPDNLPVGQTGLTQSVDAFAVQLPESVPQRMNRLIQSLGLNTPAYDIHPSTFASSRGGMANGYWNIAATFDSRDIVRHPELAGRIGEVDHVFGKAKAREACSQKIVQILEKIEANRRP